LLSGSSSTTNNEPINKTNDIVDNESESSKNSKYFSELNELYILGKNYEKPIGKII
jgi:hypothetical protein